MAERESPQTGELDPTADLAPEGGNEFDPAAHRSGGLGNLIEVGDAPLDMLRESMEQVPEAERGADLPVSTDPPAEPPVDTMPPDVFQTAPVVPIREDVEIVDALNLGVVQKSRDDQTQDSVVRVTLHDITPGPRHRWTFMWSISAENERSAAHALYITEAEYIKNAERKAPGRWAHVSGPLCPLLQTEFDSMAVLPAQRPAEN